MTIINGFGLKVLDIIINVTAVTSFIYRVRRWLTQSRQDKILELDWYGMVWQKNKY